MSQVSGSPSPAALAAKQKMAADFRRKGIIVALLSGLSYGFYTAFMTLGMAKGVWADWYGPNPGLTAFAVTYLLSAVGAACTDSCSAVWSLGIAFVRGTLGDFFRSIKTLPGLVIVIAALIGGPIASTCYVLGLQEAGSAVVPIAALCPAIGAILSRFMFKQELNPRMLLGIAICFGASVMIGSTGLGSEAPEGMILGLFFGFLAALGWGFEGCVCGYGTAVLDAEVGITIRQVTSGLSNLIILVPIFAYFGKADAFAVVSTAFTDTDSIIWFAVAGFCAYFAFMLWYKGNGMCGTALGMACNGTFSFWGPFCCWIVLGLCFGMEGWALPPIVWAGAVVMVIGIFIISVNPMDFFSKKEQD